MLEFWTQIAERNPAYRRFLDSLGVPRIGPVDARQLEQAWAIQAASNSEAIERAKSAGETPPAKYVPPSPATVRVETGVRGAMVTSVFDYRPRNGHTPTISEPVGTTSLPVKVVRR